MSEPKRIQRKRTKGWRMPEGAVYVGRPGRWSNSWEVGSTGWLISPGGEGLRDKRPHPPLSRAEVVQQFRNLWDFYIQHDPEYVAAMRSELRGHDLACWCPLDQPCHADVLLEISNGNDA